MKKLLSLIATGLLLASSMAFAYSDGGLINVKEMSGGTSADPVRVYRLVRYPEADANGTSLTAGDVVVWDCVSDDGVTVNVLASTASTDAVAGVVVATIATGEVGSAGNTAVQDIGKRNWGYIQVKGLCTFVNVAPAGGSAGVSVVASGTARNARATVAFGALGGGTPRLLGFAYDAPAAGPNDIYIDVS